MEQFCNISLALKEMTNKVADFTFPFQAHFTLMSVSGYVLWIMTMAFD